MLLWWAAAHQSRRMKIRGINWLKGVKSGTVVWSLTQYPYASLAPF
jgi:hypothetical protein